MGSREFARMHEDYLDPDKHNLEPEGDPLAEGLAFLEKHRPAQYRGELEPELALAFDIIDGLVEIF